MFLLLYIHPNECTSFTMDCISEFEGVQAVDLSCIGQEEWDFSLLWDCEAHANNHRVH